MQLGVVGQAPYQGHLAGAAGGQPLGDEAGGVDQQAGAGAFLQAVLAQVAHLDAEARQGVGLGGAAAAFALDDVGLDVRRWVVEFDGDEALPGAGLEVLEGALVARVVGDAQQKAVVRLDDGAAFFDGQEAAVVGEGVDENRGVLAGLDHLVEVEDGAGFDGARHGAVDPAGAGGVQQVTPDEVAGGQVFVASNGDEGQLRSTGGLWILVARDVQLPAQLPRHVLHEARLAAAGRPLQQHRDALVVRPGEQFDLVGDRPVIRLAAHHEGFHGVFADLRFRRVCGHIGAGTPLALRFPVHANPFEISAILPALPRTINNGPVTAKADAYVSWHACNPECRSG